MGKKLVGIVAAIVVVIVAACLIAPYFIGQRVESGFRKQVAAFSQRSGIPVQVAAYDRGWFSADAKTMATFDKHKITVHYHIHHGPLPGFNLATIRARWQGKDLVLTHVQRSGKPLLAAHTEIGLTGQTSTAFKGAPFQGDMTNDKGQTLHIAWQGIHGKLNPANGKQHVSLVAPGLQINGGDATSGFKNLRMTGVGNPIDSSGHQKQSARDLTGHSVLRFDRVFARNPHDHTNMAYSGSLKSRATATKANRWSLHSALKVHSVAPGQGAQKVASTSAFKLGDLNLKLGLTGLNAHRFIAMVQAWQQARRSIQTAQSKQQRQQVNARLGRMMAKRLPKLLTNDSRIHLGVPVFKTNQGAGKLAMNASLKPASAASRGDLPGLVRRTIFKASAKMDKSLMHWAIQHGQHPNRSQQLLTHAVKQGFLGARGRMYQTSLYLDHQTMRINGQTLPDRTRRALMRGLLRQ